MGPLKLQSWKKGAVLHASFPGEKGAISSPSSSSSSPGQLPSPSRLGDFMQDQSPS